MNRRSILRISLAVAFGAAFQCAFAAGFPQRPVRLIVPYQAGGAADAYARLVGLGLTKMWGQPVVVENRPGASGALGIQTMLSSAKDGYTLSIASVSLSSYSLLNPHLPFKDADVQPIVNIASAPNVLVVNPSAKVNTLSDYIAAAKAQPGALSFGTAGNGTTQHVAGELLKLQANIDITAIPYKGNMPALQDVMAGQIFSAFAAVPEVQSFVKAGKLKPIVVMDKKRSSHLPNTPTIAETGFPAAISTLWWGIVAARGIPTDIAQKINADVNKVLADPALRQQIQDAGSTVEGGTAQQFADQIAVDRRRVEPLVTKMGLVAN